MVDEVIDRLAERCLLLVHGSSGSGKSSLIRAGVLPRLERQHRRNRFGWSTAAMRPAGGPLWNLAEALIARDRRSADAKDIDALRRRFDRETANLRSIVSDLPDMRGGRLCLLVDQFEELFQYIRGGSLEEATLFVDLMTSALEDDPASPLRVILTMRSDFLGECVRWPKLAGAVNRTQYLLPPMEQAALQDAICRPAELYQGKVDLALADRMIADAQGEQDQLPLIQHALMRLWDLTTVVNGTRHLDISLYERHGPLTRILDQHADEVAGKAEPGNKDLPLVSGIFRALCDLNDAGQPIRRPQTLKELSAITGAPNDDVRTVIDAFRADGVSFLKPYGEEPLDDREPIDISHEALMRCWKRLADRGTGWLWDEFRQGLAWKSLLAQAELFQKNTRNVLSPPTTADRQQWLSSRREAWAARYGDNWDKVAALMEASHAYSYHLRRRTRLLAFSLGLLLLLTIAGILWGANVAENATQALNKLYAEEEELHTEQAKGIWSEIGSSSDKSSLTPRQRNALWQIARSEPIVRKKFVALLSQDPDLAIRFATNAAVISRAIGLDWPQTTDQVQAALGRVLDAMGKTTAPDSLESLAQAIPTLAPKLTGEQAQTTLVRLLDAVGKTTDSDALEALAQAVQALAPKLTGEQAQTTLVRLLDAVGKTTDSDALGALAQAIQALVPNLTVEQGQDALGGGLEKIEKTTDSDQLGALVQAVQALVPKLTAEQAQATLVRVLDAVGKTKHGCAPSACTGGSGVGPEANGGAGAGHARSRPRCGRENGGHGCAPSACTGGSGVGREDDGGAGAGRTRKNPRGY
jgi:ribosomal protein S7